MKTAKGNLNWDDLKFFLITARSGKLISASAGLNVDHTTVSRRISALEEACGARLFDRSPRGYALTEAGRRLLPFAEAIENAAVTGIEAVGGMSESLSGAVRIGAPDGIASTIVAQCAQDLSRTYPDLEIQIIAAPRHFSLSRREADFAISVSRPTTGRLKTFKIADYNLHLYAAAGFIERHPPLTTIADLRRVRGIGYVSDLIFDKNLDYIPLVGPELTPHLTSTSLLIQLEWTVAEAGVCILPDFLAVQRPSLKPLLADQIEFQRSFWMILHEDLVGVARIRRVSDHVTEAMRSRLHDLQNAWTA